jgi:RNA polymerase sigma-70 factor (ECF subfamily)
MALVQFFRQVQTFQYDSTRRFRGWLRRLVHSAWCDFAEGCRDRNRGKGGSDVLKALDSVAARDDLAEEVQKEHDRVTLRLAMGRVKARVEERTWQAFWLLSVEGLSGLEVVKRLGMRLGTAFAASSKVRRMIRREVELLESLEP